MMKAERHDFFDPNLPLRSFFSPGRINLIGEHLDYNGGHVFPGAISLGITGIVQERHDSLLVLRSSQEEEEVRFDLEGEIRYDPARGWANYPLGAAHYLRKSGHAIGGGRNILYTSTLPRGSGLSSSAAIELLTAFMLVGPEDDERIAMALLMQKMENEFIGVRCGIMDQFAIAMGKRGHAMLLDTETLGYEHVPVFLPGHTLIIIDSNRPRSLADSKYNERREECAAAFQAIRTRDPSVQNLASASPDLVETIHDPVLKRRARHVVTENARVLEAGQALRGGDLPRFGALLSESHRSLRDDYEVTGIELDTIAAASLEAPGCAGARMTGAGFGGCALALVETESLDVFKKFVAKKYHARTNRTIDFYETDMSDGVRELAGGETPGTQA